MEKLADYLFWEYIFLLAIVKDSKKRFERKAEWPLFV
jgi:hypothetical protein